MKTRKRFCLLSAIGLALTAWMLLFCLTRMSSTQQLPGGSRLKLVQVSYGTNHSAYFGGNALQRHLRRWLRDQPVSILGYPLYPRGGKLELVSVSNTICFVIDGERRKDGVIGCVWDTETRVIAEDGQGTEAAPHTTGYGEYLVNSVFRGDTIRLRFLQRPDGSNWIKVAEFQTRNPIPRELRR